MGSYYCSCCNVVDASLQWETIEQYFLWQLISVHTIPVEHIMPILPKLDFTGNNGDSSFPSFSAIQSCTDMCWLCNRNWL